MVKYSKTFKQEALKLSDEIGLKQAAAQLGLPYYTLADWRHRNREAIEGTLSQTNHSTSTDSCAVNADERIRLLEKENAELREANEILKDALGFFAKDRKK